MVQSQDDTRFVLSERDGRTVVLTLNRPKVFNVLSDAMMHELEAGLAAASADKAVSAVIIRAEGKGFCAGHDLKEVQAHRNDPDGGRAAFEATFAHCGRLMDAIMAMAKPVIAEVQGIATAAGCQLVATCDLAVASSAARFGVNGIDVGLFCSTPMVALSRNVGPKKTFELLTTGRLMDAGEALAAGLVNHVVAPDDLHAHTLALAARIGEKSPATIALGKHAFYRQLEMPREAAYDFTADVMVDNLMAPDCREGIAAFIDKRKPRWEDS